MINLNKFFSASLRLCVKNAWIVLCVATYSANATEKELKTSLTEVTVFQSGAQVKRIGSMTIPAGEHEIKIKDATALLVKESIQVKGEGNFTILSVNHQVNLEDVDNQKTKWTELEAKQKDLMKRMEELSVKLQVLNAEEATIMNLSSITTAVKGVTVEQMAKAQETVKLKLTLIKTEKLQNSRQVLDLFEEHKTVTQRLVAMKTPKQTVSYEIVVKVFAKTETKANFEINYIVPNARWFPTYDLRVKDVASPMTIEYKANVSQESGEDWNNVKLKLSTGDPSQSSKKPEIASWWLYLNQNYVQPRAATNFYRYTDARFTKVSGVIIDNETGATIPWCNIVVPGTNIGTMADGDGNFNLVLPANATSLGVYSIGYQAQSVTVTEKNMKVKMQKQYMALNETVKTDYEKNLMTVDAPMFHTDYDKDLYTLDVPVNPIYGGVPAAYGDANGSYAFSSGSVSNSASYNVSASEQINYSTPLIEASKITATKTLNIVSTEFLIDEKYTVLSDPKSIIVTIESINTPATYQYFCAPRLDKDVFLTAQLVNWEQYNLLEGQANVFFEGTFIGNTFFDTRYLVDTLEISLGRDKSIKVERKKSKEYNE